MKFKNILKRNHDKEEKAIDHLISLKFHKLKYCSGSSGDSGE